MNKLSSILVIVDPGASAHPCVEKAARLARGFHARVELLVCDVRHASNASNFLDAETYERIRSAGIMPHRELLETLAEPLRAAELIVDTQVALDKPLHKGLLDRIRLSRPDLVVKDTHYHSIARRTLLTNTDWHLIRDSPAPLLLVKSAAWPVAGLKAAGAVDPGHPDDKPWALDHEIIAALEDLSTGLPLQISIINAFSLVDQVINASAGCMPDAMVIGTDALDQARQQQMIALRQLTSGHRIDRSRVHLVDGAPRDVLPAFTEHQHIDVLAMGAVSRSGLFNLFIGGTAEALLDRLSCDALIVKPSRLAETLWRGAEA